MFSLFGRIGHLFRTSSSFGNKQNTTETLASSSLALPSSAGSRLIERRVSQRTGPEVQVVFFGNLFVVGFDPGGQEIPIEDEV